MPDPPTDLCVLADPYLMGYQVQTIERAVAETGLDVPLVVVNRSEGDALDPGLEAKTVNERIGFDTLRVFLDVLDRERAWTLVIAERKLAEQFGESPVADALRRVHVDEVPSFSDADVHYVSPEHDGAWAALPPNTVTRIGDTCDVAVRFGFGLLAGDVLNAPAFGVLSFHPADLCQYRGLGAPQAWIDGRERMGVTLQRLSEDIDGGEIVAYEEVDVRECATLWDVYALLYGLYPSLLVDGIRTLREPSAEVTVPESLGPYYSIDTRHRLSFAGRTLAKNTMGRVRRVVQTATDRGE